MVSRGEATVEDLYKVRGKAEIVNGRILHLSPSGGLPSYAAWQITMSLRLYEKASRRGYAIGGNVAFVVDLPHRKSFCPDAAFYTGKLTMEFGDGAPIFTVEVRNEDEYGPRAERQMVAKRADYFAAGTLVVWDVDLLSDDVVKVYRASEPQTPTIYRRGEFAEAEPALPGWTMPVDDLFLKENKS
ncbi:MAG TPA: Uma2 family endonuclease [Pyrinomonadaceae bacterium]